jgi:hypothetical protein
LSLAKQGTFYVKRLRKSGKDNINTPLKLNNESVIDMIVRKQIYQVLFEVVTQTDEQRVPLGLPFSTWSIAVPSHLALVVHLIKIIRINITL